MPSLGLREKAFVAFFDRLSYFRSYGAMGGVFPIGLGDIVTFMEEYGIYDRRQFLETIITIDQHYVLTYNKYQQQLEESRQKK